MQRRGGSGKPRKKRRTTRPKARKAPVALLSAHSSELDFVKRERDEAREQLAAASDLLGVISKGWEVLRSDRRPRNRQYREDRDDYRRRRSRRGKVAKRRNGKGKD